MDITSFIQTHYIGLHIFVVVASLIIMAKASDLSVYGVSNYARKLGLSDQIIGMIVVSVAASMPELVSAIQGSVRNEPGIVLGTLFGSNIAGLALVLGISAIIVKKYKTRYKVLEGTNFWIWVLLMIPFILILDGNLSKQDGMFLVFCFVFYLIFLWKKEGKLGKVKKDVKIKNIWKDGLIFSGSLVAILLSARWLVLSSLILANYFNISTYIIALTIIGVSGSLPDLMVVIRSIKQSHQGIGYGNIIGSMVIKSLLFLGAIVIVNPIIFDISSLLVTIIFSFMMITFVLGWATRNKSISWREGTVLLAMYAAFIVFEFL